MVKRYLSPKELAERFDLPVATIYDWRVRHRGPRGIKCGRHVRYPIDEVERWEAEQMKASA